MVSEEAIEYTQRMDMLAEEMFGERYTLKTIYWNDGDFRLLAYKSLKPEVTPEPDAERVYYELVYQHSKMEGDEAIKQPSVQQEAGPRSEARQEPISEEATVHDLPPVDLTEDTDE